MSDIIHQVGIRAPADHIYELLTTDKGLCQWWTSTTKGAADVGSLIEFRFGDNGPDFKVTELIPGKCVRWKHSGTMPQAWEGTEIAFQLREEKEQTFVKFTHANWKEPSDFMAHCSTKWAVFMLSLKEAAETGKGKPFPNDIQIDHT